LARRTLLIDDTECRLTTKDALAQGEKVGRINFGPATRAVNAHYSPESKGWHVDVDDARVEPVQNTPCRKRLSMSD
jgi:hypothetical protein